MECLEFWWNGLGARKLKTQPFDSWNQSADGIVARRCGRGIPDLFLSEICGIAAKNEWF
jgi:hypothetical protein